MARSLTVAALLAVQPFSVGFAQQPPKIPLVQELVVVTTLNDPMGDYESIKTVTAATDSSVALSYTAENPSGTHRITRTVGREDLLSANLYARLFDDNGPTDLPGSTAIGTSRQVLIELKANGSATFRTYINDGKVTQMVEGRLTRVESSPVSLAVILNDERALLPTIHAKGMLQTQDGTGHDAEFFFLDDPDNPLCLRYVIAHTSAPVLNVVKISVPSTSRRIEVDLSRNGRATVYGIYFDFGSARVKDESESVLRQIADVMTTNDSWTLRVEGHTDNIGGDAYNLELSRSRAAAVRELLIRKFNISPSRLQAVGFGASRPKDTNDTLEGRTRNRRVELVKE